MAYEIGMVFFRDARSEPTGLPVTPATPQMPSRSSIAWKASPTWAPNVPTRRPWRLAAGQHGAEGGRAESSAPVLAAAIVRQASTVTSTSDSKRHVVGLAGDHLGDRVGQEAGGRRAGVARLLQQHLVRQLGEGVADEDGLWPRRRAPTPSGGCGARGRRP